MPSERVQKLLAKVRGLEEALAEARSTILARDATIDDLKAQLAKALADLAACEATKPPPPPPPAAEPAVGFSPGGYFLSDLTAADRLRTFETLGGGWFRLDVPYGGITRARAVADVAHQLGYRVLGVLMDHSGDRTFTPIESVVFATEVAKAGFLDAIEWWNEPNIPSFWNPPDPVKFAASCNAAYNAVRAVDPHVPFISGGLSPARTDAAKLTIAPTEFLARMNAAGLDPAISIGWHPYCYDYGNLPSSTQGWSAWYQATQTPDWKAGREFWFTEFGASTGGDAPHVVSEQVQADIYADGIRLVEKYRAEGRKIGPLIFFQERDNLRTFPITNFEGHYGMMRSDWSAKLALDRYRSALP